MSILEHLTEFRITLQSRGLRPRSIGSYAGDVRRFERWLREKQEKSPDLGNITPADVRQYRDHLCRARGLAAGTVNRRLAGLRVFLDWAVTAGYLPTNPGKKVAGVKQSPVIPRWLNREEQHSLRAAVTAVNVGKRDQAIMLLLLNTGLRVNELTALRFDDVIFSEDAGELHISKGRGGVSRRMPLNVEAREALAAYLAERDPQPGNWLFTGRKEAIGERTVQRLVKKYARRAGLEAKAVNIHILRHTFCKNLVEAGVPLERVAMLLGNRDLNGLRVYLEPDEDGLLQDVEKIANLQEEQCVF